MYNSNRYSRDAFRLTIVFFYSVVLSMPPKINALSFAQIAQTKKRDSFPTYNCIIAGYITLNPSPS